MNALIIARLTFREAARRKILLAALILGLAFLVTFGLGFHFIVRELDAETNLGRVTRGEIYNFLMMSGLYVVNFLTVMMTVLTSVDTISGEIDSGTIHTILSKPVRRWEVVVGKWLGFAGMLSLYLVLMAGGILSFIFLRAGYLPPNPLSGIGLMWLNALVLLTVSLLGGTRFSTLANGVLVFGLFSIAFIGGWIEQIGSFFQNQAASSAAIHIGVITSLLLPSEALWRRAAYELQSPLVAAFGVSPFSSVSVPSPLMILYAVIYLAAGFGLTIRWFSRRDM